MLVFYLAALDSDDDKNKFEYIYRKYYRFMLHTAAGIIKNPTLAEDAVHETFVQLLRGIDTLRIDNERALKSYLYMVTRERSIDFLRKWERRRGAQPDYERNILTVNMVRGRIMVNQNKEYYLGLYEKSMPNTLSWEEKLKVVKEAGFDYLEMSIDETEEKLARLDQSVDGIKNANDVLITIIVIYNG